MSEVGGHIAFMGEKIPFCWGHQRRARRS